MILLRDVTGADDPSNEEKPPVLESLDDLTEIEVPGVLLEVPAGAAGELLEVENSDLSLLSPSLGQVLSSHQHHYKGQNINLVGCRKKFILWMVVNLILSHHPLY